MTSPRKTVLVSLLPVLCFALTAQPVSALALASAPQEQPRQQGQPAAKSQPAREKEPDYSQEAFVVEQLKTSYRFEKDGTGRREVIFRARVQSEAALQGFGQLYFPYLSANERVEFDYVRARKPGGALVAAATANAQDLTGPVTQEAPVYTDLRMKQVTVPGLRPGDSVEYRVVWRLHTPLAPNQFWLEHEFLKNDVIVLDERLEVDVPADSTVKLKTEPGLDAATSEQAGRRTYAWKHANLKREEADDAKKRQQQADDEPKPPHVQLTTFKSWAEVGQWYADLERERIVPDASVRAKAAELVRGRATDLEKVEALYDHVAKNFRYVSLSFGQGRYQPHAAAEVFANQYGDCKDKHTLLAAMLRAAGLRAHAALIPSTRKIDPEVPSPAQFDHVITAIPLGDQTVWVDTTTEVAPFRLLAAPLRDKHALLVADGAPARLEKTPADPPFTSTETVEIEGQVNELGKLTARSRVTVRGDKELLLRLMFRRTPRSDWKELGNLLTTMSGLFVEVSEVRPGDPAATDKPFQVEYDFSTTGLVEWSSKRSKVMLPLPTVDLPSADDEKRGDSRPIKFDAPAEITYRVRLTLPAGYEARAPLPVAVSRDYAEYRSSYKVEGSTVVAERTLRLRARELPAARRQDYAAFHASARADAGQTFSLEGERANAPTVSDSTKTEDLIEAGEAAERDDDYARAEALYRRALDKEPKHKTARRRLGVALWGQRKYDEAVRTLRQQTESNPFDDEAYDLIGQILWYQQNYSEAEAAFRKQLEVTPLNQSAQRNLAGLLVAWRKYKEAVPELEKAISLEPEEEHLFVSLGNAHLHLGQTAKAVEAYDRAVKLAPGPPMWNDVAYGLALGKLQLDRAQQYAESAVTAVTTNLRNAELDQLTPEDLAYVASLSAYWDTLGWVHFQKGNLDAAERYVAAGWLLGQYGEGGYHVGQILEKRGRTEEAVWAYAMGAVAYQPVPEARESLTRLTGKEADEFIRQAAAKLEAMRTVRLGPLLRNENEKVEADFFVTVVPGAGRAAKIEGAKFVGGSEKLRPSASALKAGRYLFTFPDDTPAKLILRGTLTCEPRGDCKLVFSRPAEVTSPE